MPMAATCEHKPGHGSSNEAALFLMGASFGLMAQGLSTGGTEGMTGSPGKAGERLRGEGTELNWLMRTTYIAPDMGGERKQQKSAAASVGEDAVVGVADRDAQIAEIEVHRMLTRISMRAWHQCMPCMASSHVSVAKTWLV